MATDTITIGIAEIVARQLARPDQGRLDSAPPGTYQAAVPVAVHIVHHFLDVRESDPRCTEPVPSLRELVTRSGVDNVEVLGAAYQIWDVFVDETLATGPGASRQTVRYLA